MNQLGTQSIETPRLLLRRFTADDAEAMFHTWAADAEVTRYLLWPAHQSVDETRQTLHAWVKNYASPGYYQWAITLKDGTLIGCIGIAPLEDSVPIDGYKPSYCIGRAFWEKGYTIEALEACVDYFMRDSGIHTLHCYHAKENPASGAVMQKAGFVYTHDGDYYQQDGTAIPAKFYTLVKNPE